MGNADRPAWFVGDLGDPWVVAIADRLPTAFVRCACTGELPEAWIGEEPPPGLVVIHRPILTVLDTQRLGRLRARGDSTARVILCVGPHARHDDLVRAARLFDAVLPEATAAETIRRHVEPVRARPVGRTAVRVISSIHDVRGVLVAACRGVGFRAEASDDRDETPARGVVVWDVPVLDPSWPERMALRARTASVVALLAFADRETVATARQAGAAACLDWPCDLDDLAYVLERIAAGPRAEGGHALPPGPASARRSEVVGLGRST
ncbi:MAG TPA: hypothetical protein VGH33_23610 [Isosphaeraceae bacterium]